MSHFTNPARLLVMIAIGISATGCGARSVVVRGELVWLDPYPFPTFSHHLGVNQVGHVVTLDGLDTLEVHFSQRVINELLSEDEIGQIFEMELVRKGNEASGRRDRPNHSGDSVTYYIDGQWVSAVVVADSTGMELDFDRRSESQFYWLARRATMVQSVN